MSESLFSGFKPSSYSDWLEKINNDLKGRPLEYLDTFTADGVRIHPLYAKDFPQKPITVQPTSGSAEWAIIEEFIVDDEKEANALALDKLNRGASGLLFYVYANVDLAKLFENIQIEHILIHLVVEGNALHVLEKWLAVAADRDLAPEQLNGTINIDPIENAARTGNWKRDPEADLLELGELVEKAPRSIKTLCVNANLYGNGGASPAQQLALSLAHLYEYVNRYGHKHVPSFWLNLAIGGRYFEEIAKFRAMRRLWRFMLETMDIPHAPLTIYAESGFRNKSIYDPWNNMLRSTTQGMSAAIGGADEMLLRPFNITYKSPQEFGNRIARNQQLIMSEESYLGKVKDPAAGSYFIENFTEILAEKAWTIFQDIEAKGGIIRGLEEGWIQDMVEESAHKEQILFDAGKLSLLGANLYPNKAEQMAEEIEEPLFSSMPENTAITPIVARRIAEPYEKKRLEEENHDA